MYMYSTHICVYVCVYVCTHTCKYTDMIHIPALVNILSDCSLNNSEVIFQNIQLCVCVCVMELYVQDCMQIHVTTQLCNNV